MSHPSEIRSHPVVGFELAWVHSIALLSPKHVDATPDLCQDRADAGVRQWLPRTVVAPRQTALMMLQDDLPREPTQQEYDTDQGVVRCVGGCLSIDAAGPASTEPHACHERGCGTDSHAVLCVRCYGYVCVTCSRQPVTGPLLVCAGCPAVEGAFEDEV